MSAAHQVRIIGGSWKRSKLPVVERPGLRPTPDRVRETVFNWLGQDLSGWRCLDAFAGSGAFGFEAASRGAAKVVLLERDEAVARSLRATALRLNAQALRVECADALAWMARADAEAFDLVFVDPPYDAGLHERAIAAAGRLLGPDGFIYVESRRAVVEPSAPWRIFRKSRAGAVHFALLRRCA